MCQYGASKVNVVAERQLSSVKQDAVIRLPHIRRGARKPKRPVHTVAWGRGRGNTCRCSSSTLTSTNPTTHTQLTLHL